MNAPGSHRRCIDRWGSFSQCVAELEPGAYCLVDARVLALHPHVGTALRARRPAAIVALTASERVKSVRQLTALAEAAPRSCTSVVVVGGGTLGDLGTVLAHLVRRGVPLIHVPTTLLAAVDSSVGGKGAVHARSHGQWVKNAWGVFHYPEQGWLCPELWTTLTDEQRRQGAVEAFKMDLCLDRHGLERWAADVPADLVKRARATKAKVCAQDPYDVGGVRRVLNFGHTFGHAFEALTRFRLAHGDAVALGMLRALDIGVERGVTPSGIAARAERTLTDVVAAPGRRSLERLMRRHSRRAVALAVQSDKKGATARGANMVLLEREGRARSQWVEW